MIMDRGRVAHDVVFLPSQQGYYTMFARDVVEVKSPGPPPYVLKLW